MPEKFTFFEKFGSAMAKLNDDDRRELAYAIVMYGSLGEEVEASYTVEAVFASLKDDIDNSKQSQKAGSKGGRPKNEPGVSGNEKPPVSGNEKPPVSENEKPWVSKETEKTESQYKPIQAKTRQEKESGARKRFFPPSAEDVAAYAMEKGLSLDADRFVDHYESNGWKVGGRAPMKDWRAAVRNWCKNDSTWARPKGGGDHDPVYSNL